MTGLLIFACIEARKVRGSLRHIRVFAHEPAERPVGGLGDSDARGDDDIRVGNRFAASNEQWRTLKRRAVKRAVNAEGETKLPGPVRQIHVTPHLWTPAPHQLDPVEWLDGANQHGARLVLSASDRVGAPIHSVDEVDVRDARRTVERRCARRSAGGGVASEIVLAEIRLRLDYSP